MNSHGVGIALDATSTFQCVAHRGLRGPLFDAISKEDHSGHDLRRAAARARYRPGGLLAVGGEARAGRSVVRRAGCVSRSARPPRSASAPVPWATAAAPSERTRAKDGVTVADELGDQSGANQAGSAGDEDPYGSSRSLDEGSVPTLARLDGEGRAEQRGSSGAALGHLDSHQRRTNPHRRRRAPAFELNFYTTSAQQFPAVASDATGK